MLHGMVHKTHTYTRTHHRSTNLRVRAQLVCPCGPLLLVSSKHVEGLCCQCKSDGPPLAQCGKRPDLQVKKPPSRLRTFAMCASRNATRRKPADVKKCRMRCWCLCVILQSPAFGCSSVDLWAWHRKIPQFFEGRFLSTAVDIPFSSRVRGCTMSSTLEGTKNCGQ